MTDHVDCPPELVDPAPCDCCGIPSTYRRSSMWHYQDRICKPCFMIWYDYGLVHKPEIKAKRLEKYGTRDMSREET